MRLDDWIDEQKITASAFARDIGVPHTTIHRILSSNRAPAFAIMNKIIVGTNNQVLPNDFYELPSELDAS